jgi:hypothetical protein
MNQREIRVLNHVWTICQQSNKNDFNEIRNSISQCAQLDFNMDPSNTDPIREEIILNDIMQRITISIGDFTKALYNESTNRRWILEYISAHNTVEDFKYWERYRNYLNLKKGLNSTILNELDNATNLVLDGMADPNQPDHFNKKGMVIGYVQSGKTSNYIGLINKAIDVGYKFIVVLTGMHNNLRQQTQIRIDEGVVGVIKFNGTTKNIGVGEIPGTFNEVQTLTTADYNGDFNTQNLRGLGINFESTMPLIAVIKKNVTPLKNINKWVSDELNRKNLIKSDKPFLIIDDECDQASIDTNFDYDNYLNREILDEEATANNTPANINSLIVSLILKFNKHAYVGYTATPYANIFIPIDDPNYKNLFPEDFIITLEQPNNYLGPEKYFKLDDIESDTLPGLCITSDEIEFINDLNQLRTSDTQIVLPESLITTTYMYILSCAIRYFRGDEKSHMSMLVHITHLNLRQKIVKNSFNDKWTEIKNAIRNNDSQLIETLRKLYDGEWGVGNGMISTIESQMNYSVNFKNIFPDENFDLPETFDDLIPYVKKFITNVEILLINSLTNDKLDYHDYPSGRKLIVFGGNTMSRGLTLEGLSTSYFVRRAGAYDTLMQMGRWFGYRKNYSDLCRIVTTDEISQFFVEICTAEILMRKDISTMMKAKVPPRDFLIRIRNSPLSIAVTSRMGVARNLQISWAGGEVITTLISKDVEIIKANHLILEDFLNTLKNLNSVLIEPFRTNSLIIRNVPINNIIDLARLNIVNNNTSLDFELLHEFYSNCGFENVDVVIIGRMVSNEDYSGSNNYLNSQIGLAERNSAKPSDVDNFRVRNGKLTDADYISNFLSQSQKQNLTPEELKTPRILYPYLEKPIISFLPINPYYFFSKENIDRTKRPADKSKIDVKVDDIIYESLDTVITKGSIPFGVSVITPLFKPDKNINGGQGSGNGTLSSTRVLINTSVETNVNNKSK